MTSLNFEHLRSKWPQLAELGGMAEQFVHSDPEVSATKMRIFVEQMLAGIYRQLNFAIAPKPKLIDLLEGDEFKSHAPKVVQLKLDAIRIHGNKAAHGDAISGKTAQWMLRELFDVGRWLYLAHVGGKVEDLPAFRLPALPTQNAKPAEARAQDRAALEMLALQEAQLEALLKRIEEVEQAKRAAETDVAALRSQLQARGQAAVGELHFSEADTRHRLIDMLLMSAGWKVGEKGANTPEVGQEVEVGHQPTTTGKGSVDYVLWDDDGMPLAVVEAKRTAIDPNDGKVQARLYADGLEKDKGRRPVIIYTNGYQIWLWDDAQGYPPRKIYGFYSKDSLQQLIFQRTHRKPLNSLSPKREIVDRLYQLNAIKRVAEKFESKRRRALIVQATGTGKTRVSIGLAELLSDANWAKRILFLCDRRELRKQAKDAFTNFTSHTPVIVRAATAHERQHRVYLATYPAMMQICQSFDPGFFDLIVADESHRSIYNIYRDIFDWFDGLQVGLTATPVEMVSRSTCSLFDCDFRLPDFNYTYEEAIDSAPPYLVPFEVYTHTTKFLREGVHGPRMTDDQIAELEDKGIDPQTLDFDSKDIDRAVYVTGTNDEVLKNLMENGIRQGDGQTLGKTIIFARNHDHAILLSRRFDKLYPQYAGKFCAVIDNYEPRAEALIDEFKDPASKLTIAISVDMLDTGIDVPEVVNLVFAKPVKSKVKFWQMIGRGTRLCTDLFGPGRHKSVFRIFDHWGNFEYFATRYKEAELKRSKGLMEQLFEARISLAETALQNGQLDVLKETAALIEADVRRLPDDSIRVKDKWREVRMARDANALNQFAPATVALLKNEIAVLMQWVDIRGDVPALEFDLAVTKLQQQRITGSSEFADGSAEVRNALSALPMHLNQVRDKVEIVNAAKKLEFWSPEKPTHTQLETVRSECRGLMRFLQGSGGGQSPPPKILEVSDTDVDLQRRKTRITEIDLAAYKANVLQALESLFETNPTLVKIRRGEPVTTAELDQLVSLALTQNPSVDLALLKEFYVVAEPLEKIIRSVVGMEPAAVLEKFKDFVHANPKLTGHQLQFLQLLQNHIGRNGTIEIDRLYEEPFTRIHAEGIDGVFKDEALADQLINLLAQFERPPQQADETRH
jgi:type I restriction enzyme R subunit